MDACDKALVKCLKLGKDIRSKLTLLERGTIPDGAQVKALRRDSKEESDQKRQDEWEQLHLHPHALFQGQASGCICFPRRQFQSQKKKVIQSQSNRQSLSVN